MVKVVCDPRILLRQNKISEPVCQVIEENSEPVRTSSMVSNFIMQFLIGLFMLGAIVASVYLDPTFQTLPFIGGVLIATVSSVCYCLNRVKVL